MPACLFIAGSQSAAFKCLASAFADNQGQARSQNQQGEAAVTAAAAAGATAHNNRTSSCTGTILRYCRYGDRSAGNAAHRSVCRNDGNQGVTGSPDNILVCGICGQYGCRKLLALTGRKGKTGR